MTTAIPLRASERDGRRLSGLLAALVVGAAGLLLFVHIENRLAERDLDAARQCGFLSADGLWVWGVTQPRPTPAIPSSGALVVTRPPDPLLPADPALPETPAPAPLVPPALSPAPPAPALPGGWPASRG